MIRALGVGVVGLVVMGAGALVCAIAPVDPWLALVWGGPLVAVGGAAVIWAVGG